MPLQVLRNGSATHDPRLDRVQRFDEKSRLYPITEALTAAERKPRSFTWSVERVLDQGQEGSCVGHAWAHELIGRPVVYHQVDHTFAREQIYWRAQLEDPWPGGSYPGADPVYEGTAVLSGAKVCQELGYLNEYRWAGVSDTPALDDLVLAVGYKGPAVLGINWYDGMFDVSQQGYIRPTGTLAGGHAILCNGVSVSGKYFKLTNSWGAGWGMNGFCKVAYADMERLLAESGEACIPITRLPEKRS